MPITYSFSFLQSSPIEVKWGCPHTQTKVYVCSMIEALDFFYIPIYMPLQAHMPCLFSITSHKYFLCLSNKANAIFFLKTNIKCLSLVL